MTATTATNAAGTVRSWSCPLCETPAGQPCQLKPEGDHLARYLDAYTAGRLSKAYMARTVGELVTVDACAVITTEAPACHYCGRTGQVLEPCCARHLDQLACVDVAGCRDYLLAQLNGGAR